MSEEKLRILIVEDENEISNVLHEFLSRSYHCATVDSAEKALALLARQPFDLILSDIMLAQMSGLEMVPQILELAPESVVIMISGQQTIEFAIEAMRAGAFDYITKPFELNEVGTSVRRALDRLKQLKAERNRANRPASACVNDLQRAVDKGEFVVRYQPKISIESRKLVGVEALVRWNHPHFDLLPPSDFIAAAEESGLIIPIGALVLRAACAQARAWHDAGLPLNVAVNLSARQLEKEDLLEIVERTLDETGLEASYLQLELTETCLMEHAELAHDVLRRLREIGVKIAIDDFGTGYSSLGYLKRLPIDFVKLDRSFVTDATTNADDAALVMAIITLAHNLRLKVIAEGVETEEQFTFLRLLRCDEGQGFLFGRPLDPETIANQAHFGRNPPWNGNTPNAGSPLQSIETAAGR